MQKTEERKAACCLLYANKWLYYIYIQIRYNKFLCKQKDNKEKEETIAACLASKFLINWKCVIVENLTGL